MPESHVGEDAVEPAGQSPGPGSQESECNRDEDEPDQQGIEKDGDTEDDAHFLRGQRPGEREGQEDGDHHGGGGEDHPPGMRDTADHRLFRVVRMVVMLLRGREKEDGVVHRDGEDHREEEDRPPGVDEPLRLEPEEAGAVAILKDQSGDAERGADGEQVGDDAHRRDNRCLQRQEQQEKAEGEDDADHERRLRR